MGAAADEEVPVVSTELYHKDFDAFVKVRSSPLHVISDQNTFFRWGAQLLRQMGARFVVPFRPLTVPFPFRTGARCRV